MLSVVCASWLLADGASSGAPSQMSEPSTVWNDSESNKLLSAGPVVLSAEEAGFSSRSPRRFNHSRKGIARDIARRKRQQLKEQETDAEKLSLGQRIWKLKVKFIFVQCVCFLVSIAVISVFLVVIWNKMYF